MSGGRLMQMLMTMKQISWPKHYLLARRDVDLLERFFIMSMAMSRCGVKLHGDVRTFAHTENYVSFFLFRVVHVLFQPLRGDTERKLSCLKWHVSIIMTQVICLNYRVSVIVSQIIYFHDQMFMTIFGLYDYEIMTMLEFTIRDYGPLYFYLMDVL